MYKIVLNDKLDERMKKKIELIRNKKYYIDGNFYLYTEIANSGTCIHDDINKIDSTARELTNAGIDFKVIIEQEE